MNGNTPYQQIPNDVLRETINVSQLYPSFIEARRRLDGYAGGMSWKKQGDHTYLIRTHDRGRIQKSLGALSPETEAIHRDFHAGKTEAESAFKGVVAAIDKQAAFARAANAGRVPIDAANVLRALDRRGLLGTNVAVAGTHSLYAYEALGGVRFGQAMMQTEDLDLFWDAKSRIRFRYWGDNPPSMLTALHDADNSFKPDRAMPYRVRSERTGFLVDVIKEEANPPWKDEDVMSPGDIPASPIREMRWIANAPKIDAIAIGLDGYPVPIAAADPRAYALYKLWLSERPSRSPEKRPRDRAQAMAVAALVKDKLAHLPFSPEHLKMFPADILTRSRQTPSFFQGGVPADDPTPPHPKRKKPRRTRGFDMG